MPADEERSGFVGGVIGRVAPAVIRRIDMDRIIAEIDVDAVAARLDLDALLARLDMDVLVDRLDVDAVAARLDLDALMARLDMAQLTAGATQDVALSGLDLARRQVVRADRTVDRLFDRVLRRGPDARPDAPSGLIVDEEPSPPVAVPEPARGARRDVSGHYAGPVSRLLALTGDLFAAVAGFGLIGAVTLFLFSTLTGVDVTLGSGGWVNRVLLAAWLVAWFWLPVAAFGRTPAMALVGVAVVRRDGGMAHSRRALVRALVLPISLAILLLGLVGLVVGRERRTLHDVAAGTAVVYDWGSRQAEQPATIREQLSARVNRRRTAG